MQDCLAPMEKAQHRSRAEYRESLLRWTRTSPVLYLSYGARGCDLPCLPAQAKAMDPPRHQGKRSRLLDSLICLSPCLSPSRSRHVRLDLAPYCLTRGPPARLCRLPPGFRHDDDRAPRPCSRWGAYRRLALDVLQPVCLVQGSHAPEHQLAPEVQSQIRDLTRQFYVPAWRQSLRSRVAVRRSAAPLDEGLHDRRILLAAQVLGVCRDRTPHQARREHVT